MYNTHFDFSKFEKRLLEALNNNEKFIRILQEQETAADKAKQMGLTSMGFGRWGKDGQVTHQTKDGKLEPVVKKEPKKKSTRARKKAPATAPKKAPTPAGTPKKAPAPAGTPKKAPAGGKTKSAKQPKQDPGAEKAQQAMPRARMSGKPLSAVPQRQLQQVATRIDDLAKMGQEAKEKGERAPNYNLCEISIPGTNLFCGDHKGIPRTEMPQFKGLPRPGSPADKLPKNDKGEVDTEEMFKQMLERDGISVSEPQAVPADRLKATQSELVGVQVAGMAQVLEQGPGSEAYERITAPIYVSRDGYVLDGHHRWAAVVAHNTSNPDNQIELQVRVIDEDILPLVKRSNEFAEEIGIRAKAADTGAAGDGKTA